MSQFGDISVTILLDMSVPLTGLETVTARGIQQLIDLPGDGVCSVALQRLGTDQSPRPVRRVVASDLIQITGPMRWANWWQRVEHGPRRIVLLVVHEIRLAPYLRRPTGVKLLPLSLAVGVPADAISQLSFIPPEHVLHTPVEYVSEGWDAVARCVTRVRSVPNDRDPRVMGKLAFTLEDHQFMSPKQPEMAYARKTGCLGDFMKRRQRSTSLIHMR